MPESPRLPALAAAAALAAGILLSGTLPIPALDAARLCAIAGAIAVVACVNLVRGATSRRAALVSTDVALLCALALAGASLHAVRHRLVARGDVCVGAPVESLTCEARVLEARRSNATGRSRAVARVCAAERPTPEASPAEEVDEASGACAMRPASGLLWISWPPSAAPPERGQLVRASGDLSRPGHPRNPGAFDFRAYLADRGIHAILTADRVELLEGPRAIAAIHRDIRRSVTESIGGSRGALLAGLLLGDTSGMPDELVGSFRRSGTVHVLAVSGLHVGFLALMVHAVLRSLRVPRRAARLAVLPCLALFAVLVGGRPSVVRAAIMAGAVIAGWSLERRVNSLNTLGAAALGILLVRPGSLFDLGFRLSFCATFGIVLMYPVLRRCLAWLGRLGRAGRLAADSISLSCSAQLGVAPVLLSTFGEISIVSPLANLAAVPLAAFSVASGVAMLATSAMPQLSRVFAASAWASLAGLAKTSEVMGAPAWSIIGIAARFWPVAALAACGVALARQSGRARRVAFAVLAAAAVTGACLWLVGPGRSRPRVIVFDVGQGDSILIETPRGGHVLIDAGTAWGGRSGPDAGRTVVAPYLKSRGVKRLDSLVVTHGHRDHYGGARTVLTTFRPRRLVLRDGYASVPALLELARAAERIGTSVHAASAGDTLVRANGCTLVVLSPLSTLTGEGIGENDRSVVLRAHLRGTTILLTGDIEHRAENELLEVGAKLSANVLKVGHHGSATSSTPSFVEAVGASVAAVSVGRGNRYGHPAAGTIRRLSESGAAVYRTDADGAVLIDVLASGPRARGFRSKRS